MTMPIHPDPAKLLADTGILYRINHEVLHPLGMALVLEIADDGTSQMKGVWATDDVEGIIFDEAGLADGQAKLEVFMRGEGAVRHAARRLALGYIVQPPSASAARPSDDSEVRPMMLSEAGRRPRLPARPILAVIFFVACLLVGVLAAVATR